MMYRNLSRISQLFFSIVVAAGVFGSQAHAQLSIGGGATVAACDDFATQVLNDPWDMSNASDINNFIPSDLTSIQPNSFANGIFDFNITANNAGMFYLLSPSLCGAHPVGGRFGQNIDLSTTKYKRLALRMYNSVEDSGGLRLIWNRDCDYVPNRTVTALQTTKKGWHTYYIDLDSIGISSTESSNANPWSSGSVKGFAISPAQTAQNAMIDFIRLEDPTSCGSTSVSYTATATGSDSLFSVYIDDDTNPFNGYHRQLLSASAASGASSLSVTSEALAPGDYNVVGILDSDYATLERTDPWDMSESTDILTIDGVSNPSFSGGQFSGTTSASPTLYLKVGSEGVSASKYSKLSFKLTRSSSDLFNIFWSHPSGSGFAGLVIDPAVYDADADGVFQVNLAASADWSGNPKAIIIRPTNTNGATFSLDWVALRASGFLTAQGDPATKVVSSTSGIHVNSPPLASIKEPNLEGGIALKPWNMRNGDFVVYQNLRNDADPNHTAEPYTAFLPDVRTVDGLRGDFFKGTNIAGNDDPNNYSTFPLYNDNPLTFDAAVYKNLCVKLNLDVEFDLCLGSVGKLVTKKADEPFVEYDGLVLIYDRWSGNRWYEYCMDMTKYPQEVSNLPGWTGIKDALRFDPHEFHEAECGADGNPDGEDISVSYYFDHIKLRQDDKSTTGKFSIVYDFDDADDTTASISFYHSKSATPGAADSQLIATLPQSRQSGVYTWDTSGLAEGTYYVYAIATDGKNSITRTATGPVQISSSSSEVSSPVLSLESPVAEQQVCNTLQVKGYALQNDRFENVAAVEVLVDGTHVSTIHPALYSLNAVAAYPNADASNTGFNTSIDMTPFSLGSHTVAITAYSTDGGSTSLNVAVQRVSSGCPTDISDPAPAGTVVNVDVNIGTPVPGDPTVVAASLTAKGVFDVTLGEVGDANCSVALKISKKETSGYVSVKSFDTSEADSSGMIKARSKGIIVPKKRIAKFFLMAEKTCAGQTTFSAGRKVTNKGRKGKIKDINGLKKALAKGLAIL
jgi:hypothetical protein